MRSSKPEKPLARLRGLGGLGGLGDALAGGKKKTKGRKKPPDDDLGAGRVPTVFKQGKRKVQVFMRPPIEE